MDKEKQYCCNGNQKLSSNRYANSTTDSCIAKSCIAESSEKSAECNSWASVPQNYDIKEACEKNEKSATNNQWCSCSK